MIKLKIIFLACLLFLGFNRVALADEDGEIVKDNIIETEENGSKAIERKYKEKYIEIGEESKGFIEIIEGKDIPIESKEGYIFVGYKVEEFYFIKSRLDFLYEKKKYILAVQNNKLKLFTTGFDGRMRDITKLAEDKFKRYGLYFEGFDERNIYIISVGGIKKFQMDNLKEVNNTLKYLKLIL